MSITEFAACIIVLKEVSKIWLTPRKLRTAEVEYKAVAAEYGDLEELKRSVDETQPVWKAEQERMRYTERQQQLLKKYPNVLVSSPSFKYYKQAEEEQQQRGKSVRERLKENWKWGALVCHDVPIWVLRA